MDIFRWRRTMPPMQRLLPFVSLVLFIVGLLLLWAEGVSQPYIADDFSYSSDIVATDNLYDAANNRYSGDRYSQGKFYYQLGERGAGTVAIRSVLDVSEVTDGAPLAQISRQREVMTSTGKYLPSASDSTANQYVFAPRNLAAGQSFVYRHVLYDAPATMKYAGQETLYGLRLYRYTATFPAGVRLAEDDSLPQALPTADGLEYHPHLQLWVEPVTGWLIKFDDSGTLTLYDRSTGKSLGLYSRYTVHVTNTSASQQAAYARPLRERRIITRQVIPGVIISILLGFVLVLLLWRMHGVAWAVRCVVGVAFAICGVVLVAWAVHSNPFTTLFVSTIWPAPPAALGFAAAAECMLLIHRRRLPRLRVGLAALVTLIGLAALLAPTHGNAPAVTLVAHGNSLQAFGQAITAHMSAYAAFTFVVLGGALLKAAYNGPRRQLALRFASFLAAMVVALSLAALLMQVLQIDETLAVSLAYPLSALTSLLFCCSGLLLLAVTQHLQEQPLGLRALGAGLVRPALLSIPLLIIGSVAQFKQNIVQSQLQATFTNSTIRIQDGLTGRLDLYNNLLVGARALFASSNVVEPGEWHSFITAYNVGHDFPGVVNVGFASRLDAAQVPAFAAARQKTGAPHFAVYPQSSYQTKTPVTYIEPQTASQQQLLGYDLFTDAARSAAMNQASTTNATALTGEVELLPTGVATQQGFMLFLPVYQNGMPVGSAAQRQTALSGYVFMSVSLQQLAQTVLKANPSHVDAAVYDDTQADSSALLYSSQATGAAPYSPRLTRQDVLYFSGHPWTVVYRAQPGFRLSEQQERSPALLLLFGGAAYAFGLAVVYFLMSYRLRTSLAIRALEMIKHRPGRR